MTDPRMKRSALLMAPITVLLSGSLLFTAGCDTTDDEFSWSGIHEVRISPDSVAMEVGETVDFSFDLLTETGEIVRGVDLNTRWESKDASVFTVEDDGLATAVAPGSAKCVIEASSYPFETNTTGRTEIMGFVGQDSARVVVH